MSDNDKFEHKWRRALLDQMKGDGVLDADEPSLFEWYVDEHSKIIDKMLSEERAFAQQQGVDLADSSGLVAVAYYIKRARYADIIYMTSLLESYLERACKRLTMALGDHIVIFRPEELTGDKWTKRQKFLERYGGFDFPEDAWSNLKTLIRVRNILVHENGSSDSISESDKNQIGKRPGISIGQHELEIENEYIDHCFSAFRSVLKFVDKRLDQAVDRSLQPQVLRRE